MMVVDESHSVRTTAAPTEPDQTEAVLALGRRIPHVVCLTGTPSLCRPFELFNQVDLVRPGLLGAGKLAFAVAYCPQTTGLHAGECSRPWELNLLLAETVMIRRLKRDVMAELPPKRRQLIRVPIGRSDAPDPSTDRGELEVIPPRNAPATQPSAADSVTSSPAKSVPSKDGDVPASHGGVACRTASSPGVRTRSAGAAAAARRISRYQAVGLAKAGRGAAWIRLAVGGLASEEKMVVFGHHRAVLDRAQAALTAGGVGYVRVDGETPMPQRAERLRRFKEEDDVRVAIVSVTAGGQGLDLSRASTAVFMEIPPDCGWIRQAEDRLHRRGQRASVMIYYLVAHSILPDADDWTDSLEDYDVCRWAAVGRNIRAVTAVTDRPDRAGGLELLECDEATRSRDEPGSSLAASSRSTRIDEPAETWPSRAVVVRPVEEVIRTGEVLGKNEAEAVGVHTTSSQHGSESTQNAPHDDQDAVQSIVRRRNQRPGPWFEVSRLTGRIHLHLKPDGSHPAGFNFHPSDLASGEDIEPESAAKLDYGEHIDVEDRIGNPHSSDMLGCSSEEDARSELGPLRRCLKNWKPVDVPWEVATVLHCAKRFWASYRSMTARSRRRLRFTCISAEKVTALARSEGCHIAGTRAPIRTSPAVSDVDDQTGPYSDTEADSDNGLAEESRPASQREPVYTAVLDHGHLAAALSDLRSDIPDTVSTAVTSPQREDDTLFSHTEENMPLQRAVLASTSPAVASRTRSSSRSYLTPTKKALVPSSSEAGSGPSTPESLARTPDKRRRGQDSGSVGAEGTPSRRKRLADRMVDTVGAPLPEGGEWKEVLVITPRATEPTRYRWGFNAEGDPLCLYCMKVLGSRYFHRGAVAALQGTPVKYFDLFCNMGDCIRSFYQRTSSGSLRRDLGEEEGGICEQCGLDCPALLETLRALPPPDRLRHLFRAVPTFRSHPARAQALTENLVAGNLWHADHVVPVYQGGGQCGLENMRTLCVLCHDAVTARQARERAESLRQQPGLEPACSVL